MSTINPIPVVRNNVLEFRAELLQERAKLAARIVKIDEDVTKLDELARIVGAERGPDAPLVVPSFEEVVDGDDDPLGHRMMA